MPELSTLLVLALLPGLGVAAGGLLAELAPRSKAWLNWSLHAAAGIVIAIAAIEVFPEALDAVSRWTVGIAFAELEPASDHVVVGFAADDQLCGAVLFNLSGVEIA